MGNKDEAKKILEFIKELETMDVNVLSRYGDHEQTKNYLKKVSKNG